MRAKRRPAPPAATCISIRPGNPIARASIDRTAGGGHSRRARGVRLSGAPLRQIALEGEPAAGDSPGARGLPALSRACRQRDPLQARAAAALARCGQGVLDRRAARCRSSARSIKQPDLAATLEAIADQGAKGFYAGRVARGSGERRARRRRHLDARGSCRLSGRRAQAADRRVSRRAHRVRLAALLGRSRACSMRSISCRASISKPVDSATRKHLVVEAMQRAYRDRAVYLGDPDFVTMPIAQLTSKDYAAGQRTSIRPDKAMPSDLLPGIETRAGRARTPRIFRCSMPRAIAWRPRSPSICSSARATWSRRPACCSTTTMDDFSIKPGTPNAFGLVGNAENAIAPNKRPLSSMTPSFIETPQRPHDHRHARRQLHHQHGDSGHAQLPRRHERRARS